MANLIVRVNAGIYGMGIYAIMLPSSGFSVAHYVNFVQFKQIFSKTTEQNSFIFGFGETPGDLVSSNKIAVIYTCDLKEQTSLNTFSHNSLHRF